MSAATAPLVSKGPTEPHGTSGQTRVVESRDVGSTTLAADSWSFESAGEMEMTWLPRAARRADASWTTLTPGREPISFEEFEKQPPRLDVAEREARRFLCRLTVVPLQEQFEAERQRLLDKKFADSLVPGPGLTTEEERRLTYVRWQLDRIEDALYGDSLDDLERFAAMHATLAETVQGFASHIDKVLKTVPRTRPPRRRRQRR